MRIVNYNIDMVAILEPLMRSAPAPLYQSLSREIEELIVSGCLKTGEKLTPHRILAFDLGVTVATVAKAYAELERLGLVTTRKGDGTFVRSPQKKIGNDFRNVQLVKDKIINLSQNIHINGVENIHLIEALSANDLIRDARKKDLTSYAAETGFINHRRAGRKWLKKCHVSAPVENIICTNGAQHALLCCIMASLRSGSAIAAEKYTYPGLMGICRTLGIKLVYIEMDEEGMDPKALMAACKKQHISAIYCMPTCQNPTTRKMTLLRRQQLVKLCQEQNLLIFEDEAHGVLVSDHPTSLYDLAPERTFTFSCFSKGVSSGLRVGYMAVPHGHIHMLESVMRSTCWMATPLAHEIAANWIENGLADKLMLEHVREMKHRKSRVSKYLQSIFCETSEGSAHYWIWLPKTLECSRLVSQLHRKGVIVMPSSSFTDNSRSQQQAIRVCVSGPREADDVICGFKIISETLRQERLAN